MSRRSRPRGSRPGRRISGGRRPRRWTARSGAVPVREDGGVRALPPPDRYASGHEGDTAKASLASRRQHLSLYVNGTVGDPEWYLAEEYRERLPKADIGKSGIRFKRPLGLDLAVLRDLLTRVE